MTKNGWIEANSGLRLVTPRCNEHDALVDNLTK